MFKQFIVGMMLSVGAIAGAHADTTLEPITAEIPANFPGNVHSCAGNSFDANDSIIGACRVTRSQACSGRGCQPVQYTTYFNVTWTTPDLTPSVPDACVTVRHHLPQTNTYTYLNGHVAADCRGLAQSSASVTSVNGVPYYLIAVSNSGLYEIVANYGTSWLVTF